MKTINTTRFGRLNVDSSELLSFPLGVMGLEDCQEWTLLADAENDAVGWLQSTTRCDVALAVVSPRRFVAGYQARISRSELAPLDLDDVRQAQVLVVVGKNERGITLNLKAPLVINLQRRRGRQIVVNGDQPIQYQLGAAAQPQPRLKTA
jgi:flagellar assembly factor FliW